MSVFPVIGQPHPFSRGEQLLAKRLAETRCWPDFSGSISRVNDGTRTSTWSISCGRRGRSLSRWTVTSSIPTATPSRSIVDRDYELTISGYLVLRLPHDEVIEDVELAVEKIRDVVQFRRTSSSPRSENQP